MPTRSVTHTILDPSGQPVPDVEVRFTADDSTFRPAVPTPVGYVTVVTDQDGAFSVDLVTNVRYMMDHPDRWIHSPEGVRYPVGTKDVPIFVPNGSYPLSLDIVQRLGQMSPRNPFWPDMIAMYADSPSCEESDDCSDTDTDQETEAMVEYMSPLEKIRHGMKQGKV